MRPPRRPLRIGRWLLRLRAGARRRAEVEDDLVEVFHLRRAQRGRAYAQWRWLLDAASVPPVRLRAETRTPGDPHMTLVWNDIRVGLRSLRANARFSLIAVLLLGLGIGLTTAVFSVVNAVLVRPLPYQDPAKLVAISGLIQTPARQTVVPTIALADVEKWRPRADTFASMGAFAYTQLPIRVGGQAFSPVTAIMDPEFLTTLGRSPALGTLFPLGSHPEAVETVIISHALWQEAFGADPRALGQTIDVDGKPYQVRGVLADDFQFPRADASYYTKPVDLLMLAPAVPGFRPSSPQFWGIGRLRDGVTLTQAQASLQSVAAGLAPAGAGEVHSVQLTTLADETTRLARAPLLTVLAIAIVLLLIAATNLMNLYFARGVDRLREMTIRRAMGSTTGQLLRLLIVESLLLAAAGGVIGVWLASVVMLGVTKLSPLYLPVTRAIDIDGVVLAFALLVAVITAVVAGLLPALHVSARTREAVRHQGMRTSAGRGVIRAQQALCITQIALGMTLVAAAGLLSRSLWHLNHVESGFDTAGVVGFDLSVPQRVDADQRTRLYQNVLTGIRALPGVERAGFISFLPPETRAGIFMNVGLEGSTPADDRARRANTLLASDQYFETMHMPLARGRAFSSADTAGQPLVAIVNETFVRRYLGGGDPLGRRIGTGFDGLDPVRTVVGVLQDTRDRGVLANPVPTVYLPIAQFNLAYGSIAIRAAVPLDTLAPAIRQLVHNLEPSVPLSNFQTLDRRRYESLREPRFYTLLAVSCAGFAIVFVTFGLYGLVSYSVGRRRTELGIRMAVGADRGTIVRLVIGQGLRMAAAGVAAGLVLTWLSSRELQSQLFQVRPLDPLTLAISAALVVAVTLAASVAPARRASRVNPISVLRDE